MKDTPFTADRLLALYDQVADAEDAIPRLRRFVLDLAVRGKLVEQDPSDEPASELLKRIAVEKARLVKAGEIKDRISPRRNGVVASTLPVPYGWEMSDLQTVCMSVTDGDHLPPPKADEGVPFLVIGDVRTGTIEFSGDRFVSQEYYGALDPIRRPRSGDLLYTLVGSYGIPVIVTDDRPFCVQRHIGILRPSKEIDVRFLARSMESQFVFDQATNCATGIAQKTVPLSGLRNMNIPLPPLAEQQRIVSKVEELMELCDRLEAARAGREAVRDRLTAATWTRLTAPDTDAETFQSHARFALQSLPTLTTRPDQIKTLRQTILNLAVRGKLVEQDPNDEPSAKLLAQDMPLPTGYIRRRKILKASPVDASVGLLGPVPPTWSYLTIQDLFDQNVVVDYADGNHGSLYPRSSEFGSDGVNFVSAKDLSNGRVNWQTCSKLNETRASQLSKGWAKTGDVLLTHNATVGRVARVVEDVEPFLLGTSVTFYRLNPLALDSNYFYYVLQSPVWQGQLEAIMAQTTRNQVSIQKQASFFVPLPPIAEQHRIVAKVDALMALCNQLEASLTTATTTRSKLLNSLLHEALEPAAALVSEAAE